LNVNDVASSFYIIFIKKEKLKTIFFLFVFFFVFFEMDESVTLSDTDFCATLIATFLLVSESRAKYTFEKAPLSFKKR
jgi:hypothetical protein